MGKEFIPVKWATCRGCVCAVIRIELGLVIDDVSPVCVDCLAGEEYERRKKYVQ